MLIVEAKTAEKIHSQEKFARQNFAGLADIGKELKQLSDDKKKMRDKLRAQKDAGKISDDDFFEKYYGSANDEYSERMALLVSVMSIKMSSSLAHALNGNSTKTLRDIIMFMDKYSIGEKPIMNDIRRVVNTRSISSNSILDLCAVIAAQVDDVNFIKELEAFGAKNKGRENLYNWIDNYELKTVGEMDTYNLRQISDTQRVALEALVHGSKNVYEYILKGKNLSDQYVLQYIEKNDSWVRKLSKTEVANVLSMEPKFFDAIIENMPDNLPEYIVDIFIF